MPSPRAPLPRSRRLAFLAAAATLAAAGCQQFLQMPQGQPMGGGDPSSAAGAPAGEPESMGAGAMDPGGAQSGSAAAEPEKHVPTTVEIKSECSKTVPVFYGEKPKFGSGKRSTVSGNSISSEGRKADGTLTVWIIDDGENGLASAKVTPDTKRVVIDRSCTSIHGE